MPSSPFTAIVMCSFGFASWACSAANKPAPPEPRINTSVWYVKTGSTIKTPKEREVAEIVLLVRFHNVVGPQTIRIAATAADARPAFVEYEMDLIPIRAFKGVAPKQPNPNE